MALGKQKIPVSLVNGINTKSDSKQLQLGYLVTAENVAFETPGKLKKSNGYEAVPTYDLDNNKLSSLKSLASYKNELNALTHYNLYAYSENVQKWIQKGKIADVKGASKTILINERKQSAQDCLFVENTKIFAYKDSSGIKYSVVDHLNDTVQVFDQTVATSTAVNPRLAHMGNVIFVMYADSGSIYYKTFDIVNPSSLSAATKIVDGVLATGDHFDVASHSNNKITVVYNNTGNVIKYFQINSDLSLSTLTTLSGESAAGSIDVNLDHKDRLLISYYNGSAVKLCVINSNLAAIPVAPTVVETIANVTNTTAQYNGTSFTVYYEVSAVATYNYLVKQNTVTLGAVVGTASVFLRSVGLSGKAFLNSNDLYIPLIHSSTLQPTYFIADSAGSIVQSISPSLSGELLAGTLPKVHEIGEGKFLFVSQIKGRIITDSGTFDTLLGINSTELSFNNMESTGKKILSNNLHLPSGILYMYDGARVTEHGYFLYPENFSVTTASTGGNMSDGEYQYCALYNYTDAYGQQHVSAPSIPIIVTLSGGTTTQTLTINLPTLRLTEKTGVTIDVYRTEAAGTIFYKLTTLSTAVANNKTVDTVSFVDTLADATILTRETLYTTGGVLDNIIAPQASIIETHKDRIFLAGLENPNRIQYSKIRSEGKAVEFNDTLYVDVNPAGGDIVSLIAMDDKLIILKESSLYYMSGEGPNNIGEDNSFITPELISSDMGCVNRDSVVLTASGIMFKSSKGIYQLGRDLSVTYIGAPIEKYNNLTITSADVVKDKNVIRFTTDSDTCLVYNYFVGQWATYTNFAAIDAEIVNSDYFYLRTDSSIYKENSSYTNNGSAIPMKIETGWLNLSGTVQGFQRVYRLLLLGEFKSIHKLRIRAAYNYKDVYTQESIVDVSDFINSSAYGDETPYGTDALYGGDGNLYQIRFNFAVQKCQSIKLSIEDLSQDGGESLSLSHLLFLVGVKSNSATVNKSNSYSVE